MTLVLVIAATIGLAAHAESVISLTAQKQLFLDDYLIQSTTNVERRIHPAEKYHGNPVVWACEPWEPELSVLYGSVIQDDGRYRMWYKAGMGDRGDL